jgi:hypothetical protein
MEERCIPAKTGYGNGSILIPTYTRMGERLQFSSSMDRLTKTTDYAIFDFMLVRCIAFISDILFSPKDIKADGISNTSR